MAPASRPGTPRDLEPVFATDQDVLDLLTSGFPVSDRLDEGVFLPHQTLTRFVTSPVVFKERSPGFEFVAIESVEEHVEMLGDEGILPFKLLSKSGSPLAPGPAIATASAWLLGSGRSPIKP